MNETHKTYLIACAIIGGLPEVGLVELRLKVSQWLGETIVSLTHISHYIVDCGG